MKRFLIALPLCFSISGCSVSPTTVKSVTQAVAESLQAPGDSTAENSAAATYVASLKSSKQLPNTSDVKKLLATAKQNRQMAAWSQAEKAAETAVKSNPKNAATWLELAEVWGEQAGALRKGRYASAISSAEWKQLRKFYARWEACATEATKASAQNGLAWFELSRASTFNRNYKTADSALWKAIQFAPKNEQIYWWGLQMYQPKWMDEPKKLVQVAQAAAKNAPHSHDLGSTITYAFDKAGINDQRGPILEQLAANTKTDSTAVYEAGAVYHYEKRQYRKAETFYNRALKMNPKNHRAWKSLADLTYYVKQDVKKADQLYRRALLINPNDGWLHAEYARLLLDQGLNDRAKQETLLAKKLGYNDATNEIWSRTGIRP